MAITKAMQEPDHALNTVDNWMSFAIPETT